MKLPDKATAYKALEPKTSTFPKLRLCGNGSVKASRSATSRIRQDQHKKRQEETTGYDRAASIRIPDDADYGENKADQHSPEATVPTRQNQSNIGGWQPCPGRDICAYSIAKPNRTRTRAVDPNREVPQRRRAVLTMKRSYQTNRAIVMTAALTD